MGRPAAWCRTLCRWCILVGCVGLSAWLVRPFVGSSAEVFWLLFPCWLLLATRGLGLVTLQNLPQKSHRMQVVVALLLIFFPAGFYAGLVWLTGSVWSWTEFLLSIYFFGCALECVLICFFSVMETLVKWLRGRLPVSYGLPISVFVKVGTYLLLVPFLFVVLAVHRPKLIPRTVSISGITITPVEFPTVDGLRIRGTWMQPIKPLGTIIVCHGVGANHADILPIIEGLLRARFQVLAFDFRGHGNSDGHTITYGWKERHDVVAAYDYCLRQRDVDPNRLFALGVSMGGASLLQALPHMPRVRAVVVDSAFANLSLMLHHQLRWAPLFLRSPLVQWAQWLAWLETGADVARVDPLAGLQQRAIPLLVIHGTSDVVVPVEHARLIQQARPANTRIRIVSGAPHIGTYLLDPTHYVHDVRAHFLESL